MGYQMVTLPQGQTRDPKTLIECNVVKTAGNAIWQQSLVTRVDNLATQ